MEVLQMILLSPVFQAISPHHQIHLLPHRTLFQIITKLPERLLIIRKVSFPYKSLWNNFFEYIVFEENSLNHGRTSRDSFYVKLYTGF